MKDDRLLALIELQSVISEKYEIQRHHEELPERLENLRNQITDAETRLADAEKAVQDNELLLTRSQKEIDSGDQKFNDLQAKLNQVKTTREYEARQKEMKAQRERASDLELLIEAAGNQKALLEEQIETARAALDEVRTRLQPEIKSLEEENRQFEKKLEKIGATEYEKRVGVPKEILERVDKLVLLREGKAAMSVLDGCCGGCGVQLSPQVIQVAKRGLDLIQCDRCSSYIYWPEDDEI